MKKYLAGLAAVSVAGGAAPTLDSVQAAPEQNTQKAATQTVQASASNNSSYTVMLAYYMFVQDQVLLTTSSLAFITVNH